MKIVFAGTPEFASKHLELLIESDNTILKVLTQPDRKSGRGKKMNFSEVKEVALREGIEVLQPESVKTDEFANTLRELSPDLLLVVAYGIIVPKQILEIPKYGCINIHASLLPRWRGASPMEHAILSGDKKSGITFMKMTKGLDEGPIFETHECSLDADDQLTDLENKLFNLSKKSNLKEAAKNLYKVLRKIKKLKYKKINVVKIPNKSIGIAINDRLKKASN